MRVALKVVVYNHAVFLDLLKLYTNASSGLANLSEDEWPNFLYISKKFFRVLMRISKSVIKSCSLSQSLLIFALLLLLLMHIINAQYNHCNGDRGSTMVKVLCYKSEGRWFDPSWCVWIFY